MKALEDLMKELPPELRKEVEEFVRSLLETRARPKRRKLRMDWAGGLAEFRGQFSSLELQRKALEWWGD